jgi:hypothetical protein
MLYTDGLLDARNAAGDLYSFARLQQLVATNPDAQQATDAAIASARTTTSPFSRSPPQFVISTGARRSGETCFLLLFRHAPSRKTPLK